MKISLWMVLATVWLNLALLCQALSADQTDLEQRFRIDATNASPESVFRRLAEVLQCRITVDSGLNRPITLHMEDARIDIEILPALSQLINCEWSGIGQPSTDG